MQSTLPSIPINTISFNNDGSLCVIGTNTGFAIFSPITFAILHIHPTKYPIHCIRILNNSNILCYIGNTPNKVSLFDIILSNVIYTYTASTRVLSLHINTHHLFILTSTTIDIIYLHTMTCIGSVTTTPNNINCAFAETSTSQGSTIVYPYTKASDVGVIPHFKTQNDFTKATNADFHFWAHSSSIACIAINNNATLITTCSENGTLFRVFNLQGEIAYEFRRGIDKAVVKCICFDYNSDFIACSTDKGMIHVFLLCANGVYTGWNDKWKKRHVFSKLNTQQGLLGSMIKLISAPKRLVEGQRSYAVFRMEGNVMNVAFYGKEEEEGLVLEVVSTEGIFYKVEVNRKEGGELGEFMAMDVVEKIEEARKKEEEGR